MHRITIGIRTVVNHNRFSLVSSIHATCFGRIDHPQTFKYMNLKIKIKCMYIYIYILNILMHTHMYMYMFMDMYMNVIYFFTHTYTFLFIFWHTYIYIYIHFTLNYKAMYWIFRHTAVIISGLLSTRFLFINIEYLEVLTVVCCHLVEEYSYKISWKSFK